MLKYPFHPSAALRSSLLRPTSQLEDTRLQVNSPAVAYNRPICKHSWGVLPTPPRRIKIPPCIQALFANLPVESGLVDQEIVTITPHIPHKTFARLRSNPPTSVSPDQLLMIARFAESQLVAAAADVISWVRDPSRFKDQIDPSIVASRCYARSMKEMLSLTLLVKTLLSSSEHVLLFDRGNSFGYLTSTADEDCEIKSEPEVLTPSKSWWFPNKASLHYRRKPRVSVVLTPRSLEQRVKDGGDPSVEQLIGNVESGEHSITVVDESVHIAHRAYRGVFADALAVAIFDRKWMFVLPKHRRSIRVVSASAGPEQRKLISDSVGFFCRMRRFRLHAQTVSGITHLLKGHLAYRQK